MDIENNQENSSREEISIGPLLRLEREKKGISIQRLSEIIKIREQVIEAIENEEWKRLPARVFIKGFIRSYTNAIGYDTIKALRLFDKTVPLRGEERPRPLRRNVKKVNSLYYIIALLLLIAAAVYIYRVHLEIDTLKAPRPAGELSAVTEEATEAQPEIIDNISFQDETDPFTDISTPYDAAGAQDSTHEIISGSNTGQMIEEIHT
ncbi:MAG: helix-turn-helix domain-containing protein, partial [Deltaproteobacteria bacterium]|nr:helix-turn-helix domain-containing protein [Deltaproteobacteria bacterium]